MKKLILLAVVAATLLSGCAKPNFNELSSRLSIGMDKGQVTNLLGAPKRTDVNQSRERWMYWSKVSIGWVPVDSEQLASDRLTVTFENGKVSKWGSATLADDIMATNIESAKIYAGAIRDTRTPAAPAPQQ